MKRCSCDFEGEADKGHDDASEQKWRERLRSKSFGDTGKTGCARHTINQAQSEESEGAGGAAKEEILQAGLGRSDSGFVECGHKIKRQPRKLESDEDHEQLLTANEK